MNDEQERLEMTVEHTVMVTEHHRLQGKCPSCGRPIETSQAKAIDAFEAGKSVTAHCDCGAKLTIPGRSKLIKPKDIGRVLVPGKANNRHARRALKRVDGSKPSE